MNPVFCFVAVVLLAFLASPPVSSAEDNPACAPERVAQLRMTTGDDGRVNIPMSIDGQIVNLLVDTGSALSLLSESAVRALRLSTIPAHYHSIQLFGGGISRRYVLVRDAVLGNAQLRPVPFFIAPDERFHQGIAGAIGAEFLRRYDVELDFANGTFNLFSPNHCAGQVVNWTKGPSARIPFALDRDEHIRVPVRLDGRDMFAAIDTGAEESVGSLEDIADEFGVKDIDDALKPGAVVRVYRYPFKLLTFEGVAVYNPDIVLYPNAVSRMPTGERDLIIGMNVLHHLHIYIAYDEGALYVTSADAH